MPAEMRRTVWTLAILPPGLLVPGVVLFAWWAETAAWESLAAVLAWLAAESALIGALALRLRRQSLAMAPARPPTAAERRAALGAAARFGVALLVLGAVYLAAIYAVVFGLWPLHESSEAGAIAMNLILLAVMIGVPVAFFLGARALGLIPRHPAGSGNASLRHR